jgi:AcrR family transcriptional regulator
LRARDADRSALKIQLFRKHDEVSKLLQVHEVASISTDPLCFGFCRSIADEVLGLWLTRTFVRSKVSLPTDLRPSSVTVTYRKSSSVLGGRNTSCNVMAFMEQESKPQGRPRDGTVDRLVIEAAQRQLANVGFAQMTIESVAAEAGVTRPTLYRRWKSKEDLATAAIAALQISKPPPAKDDVWSAVEAELVHFRRSLERPNGMSMIGMVLLEERRVPELAAMFRSRLIEPRRQRMTALLLHGIERGEIPAGADIGTAVASAIGSFYAHYIATGAVPKNWERKTILFLRQALR